jgi:hypothetical protein
MRDNSSSEKDTEIKLSKAIFKLFYSVKHYFIYQILCKDIY